MPAGDWVGTAFLVDAGHDAPVAAVAAVTATSVLSLGLRVAFVRRPSA